MSKKTLCPRDLHPGDYVFADLYLKEDNTVPVSAIIRADIVHPHYLGVIEGSGVTKYAWSQIHPIPLTQDNLKKFDMYLISDPRDYCTIFAKGLVTIDAEMKPYIDSDDCLTPRVYFNDGDGVEVNYLHEAQQYIYERSAGTYDFDLNPTLHVWNETDFSLVDDMLIFAEDYEAAKQP